MDGSKRPSHSLLIYCQKEKYIYNSGTQVDVSGGRRCFPVLLEMKEDL